MNYLETNVNLHNSRVKVSLIRLMVGSQLLKLNLIEKVKNLNQYCKHLEEILEQKLRHLIMKESNK